MSTSARVALAVFALLVTLPLPAGAWRIQLQANALDNSEANRSWLSFDETDGLTAETLSTGLLIGTPYGTQAEALAGADLAAGSLRVYADAVGIPSRDGYSSTFAQLRDTVTFDMPAGVTESVVDITLAVSGTAALSDFDPAVIFGGCGSFSTGVSANLWFGGLLNDSPTIDPCGTGDTSFAVVAGGPVTVQDGVAYSIVATLQATVDTRGYGIFDFANTGLLGIEPQDPGVTFTSGSGVLLNLIPEPASGLLLGMGLAGLIFLRRAR